MTWGTGKQIPDLQLLSSFLCTLLCESVNMDVKVSWVTCRVSFQRSEGCRIISSWIHPWLQSLLSNPLSKSKLLFVHKLSRSHYALRLGSGTVQLTCFALKSGVLSRIHKIAYQKYACHMHQSSNTLSLPWYYRSRHVHPVQPDLDDSISRQV